MDFHPDIFGRFTTHYTQGFFYEITTAFIFQLLNKFLSQLIPTIYNADLYLFILRKLQQPMCEQVEAPFKKHFQIATDLQYIFDSSKDFSKRFQVVPQLKPFYCYTELSQTAHGTYLHRDTVVELYSRHSSQFKSQSNSFNIKGTGSRDRTQIF